MNLEKAFVLLSASFGIVAGFAPSRPSVFSVTKHAVAFVPKVGVSGSVLFSEVSEATESAVEDVTEVSAEDTPSVEGVTETEEEESPKEEEPASFDKTIYVGNVSFNSVESDIREAFARHGTVDKVQMPLDRNTGLSRGFAFVAMSNADEHAAAIAALDQTEVGGRTIYVNESLPKDQVKKIKRKSNTPKRTRNKIYVGNLNFDTTVETLQAAFAEFGEVSDCFIPSDFDGNSRGYGFIQMEEEDLSKAIEGMNGTELDGRTLSVNISLPKGTKTAPKQTKLYVGNLSWGTEEEALRELFEEYGKVIDCYIPTDRETGQHRGFAFVSMDPEDALRAADETDGYELDGRILRVNEAQPKGSRTYNDNDGYGGGDAGYDGGDAFDDSWSNEH